MNPSSTIIDDLKRICAQTTGTIFQSLVRAFREAHLMIDWLWRASRESSCVVDLGIIMLTKRLDLIKARVAYPSPIRVESVLHLWSRDWLLQHLMIVELLCGRDRQRSATSLWQYSSFRSTKEGLGIFAARVQKFWQLNQRLPWWYGGHEYDVRTSKALRVSSSDSKFISYLPSISVLLLKTLLSSSFTCLMYS